MADQAGAPNRTLCGDCQKSLLEAGHTQAVEDVVDALPVRVEPRQEPLDVCEIGIEAFKFGKRALRLFDASELSKARDDIAQTHRPVCG